MNGNAFLLRGHGFTAAAGPDGAFLPARGAANLANDWMGVIAETTVSTALDVVIDLGEPLPVDSIALLATNVAELAPIAVAAKTADGDFSAGGQPLGAMLLQPGERRGGLGHALWLAEAPVLARWWRVRVPAIAGQSLRAARLVLGARFQPRRNFEWGARRGVIDDGDVVFGRHGALGIKAGRKRRTAALSFPLVTKTEAENVALPLLEAVGNTEPLLLLLDPAAGPLRSRRLYYGMLAGELGMTWRSTAGFEKRLTLESLI